MNNLTKKANLVRECNQLYKKIVKLSNYMNSREFSKLPEDEQVIIAEQYKHMSLQHELYADRIEMLERKDAKKPTKSDALNKPINPEPSMDEAKAVAMIEKLLVPVMEELPEIIRICKKIAKSLENVKLDD